MNIVTGPFKPYLAENISLQSSNCNILGLAATVAFFANISLQSSNCNILGLAATVAFVADKAQFTQI